jgi:3D (Asp-Asp-Asp) domain-containing protein
MVSKKIILPIVILSFIFIGLMLFNAGQAVAAEGNLFIGSRGDAVVQVQQALNSKGYWCGTADGIFGPKTYSAVTRFQREAGLDVDGIVGPQTKKALGLGYSSPAYTPSRGARTLTLVATGYCPCAKCNYPYGGHPSYLGYPLKKGIVAVDPRVIPMGSRLYIEGYGSAIAADQGNAIKGNRIDLCFSSHQEALNWGIKKVRVTVY